MRYALLLLLLPARLAFADEDCASVCAHAPAPRSCVNECFDRNEANRPEDPRMQFLWPSQHHCTMPLYLNGVKVSQFESDECEDE